MDSQRTTEEIEVRVFLEAIYLQYGYDLRDYHHRTIASRIQQVMRSAGIAHLGELQHQVLHHGDAFEKLLNALTVQVTGMFRDTDFYRSFKERVVPILRSYAHAKIWHAGCATGEEVFATAILLREADLADRVQIYATDLSGAAIAATRGGNYRASQLDGFRRDYLSAGGTSSFDDYCTVRGDRLQMDPELVNGAVITEHNLVSDGTLGEMNVIFCRNVLIYFQSELRRHVLRLFDQSLCYRGFLCLGTSESIGEDANCEPFWPEQRIYRKRATLC